ncbi:unnamed protein product [Camellia sinensis]
MTCGAVKPLSMAECCITHYSQSPQKQSNSPISHAHYHLFLLHSLHFHGSLSDPRLHHHHHHRRRVWSRSLRRPQIGSNKRAKNRTQLMGSSGGDETLAETEATATSWEGEGGEDRGQGIRDGGVLEESEEESYPEPSEEAKIFVGNLPYDIDSEKLAQLFDQAGIVEIAEVIYNRETDQSRGFGFVTMSTVEEAEKAVEMFHRYGTEQWFAGDRWI